MSDDYQRFIDMAIRDKREARKLVGVTPESLRDFDAWMDRVIEAMHELRKEHKRHDQH